MANQHSSQGYGSPRKRRRRLYEGRWLAALVVVVVCVVLYSRSVQVESSEANQHDEYLQTESCPLHLEKPLRKAGSILFENERPVIEISQSSCRKIDAGHCFRFTNDDLRCLPSFIIGGAQKAATGWLRQRLGRHPQLAQGADKEVHYFDLAASTDLWQKQYLSWFNADSRHTYTFEKTPDYLPNATSLAMIRFLMPSIRLVFLLRNPTSRAYSAFQHHCRRSRIGTLHKNKVIFQLETSADSWQKAVPLTAPCLPKDFDILMRDTYKFSRLVAWGYYAQNLHAVRHNFADAQIYVAFSESAFAQNPNRMLSDIIQWLGLPAFDFEALPTYTDALGRNQLRKPGLSGLLSLIYLKFNLPMVYSHSPTPMKSTTKAFLNSLYRRANRHLDTLLLHDAPSITVFPPRPSLVDSNVTLLPPSWSR